MHPSLVASTAVRDFGIPYDMKLNEKNLTQLNQIILSYLDQLNTKDVPVVEYCAANELQEKIDFSLPKKQQTENEVFSAIEEYLTFSQRTLHPQFNNQLYAGILPAAFMGEVVSALTNTSMATYEIAPVATLIEKALIERLCRYIGYEEFEGIMCTGGSNANMLAIHCARAKDDPDVYQKGNQKRYAIFVSKEAHYSFEKAINLMGLGLDSLKKIDSDRRGKMCCEDLKKQINDSLQKGETPLMIASTAGTTVKGVFDPINEINEIAKEYKIWHHIDGAWGGSALISQKTKSLLEGCEFSDSFTWDTHKVMGTGVITSFFLTPHKGILQKANSTSGGNKYIFHDYENKIYDTGPHSLQCGRKVDALKLWLAWQYYGDEGYANYLDQLIDSRDYFVSKLKAYPSHFRLIDEPEFLNVCFQVLPTNEDCDLDQFNFEKRFELSQEGFFQINFSRDGDTIFFRHIFANINVKKADIDHLIGRLVKINSVEELL